MTLEQREKSSRGREGISEAIERDPKHDAPKAPLEDRYTRSNGHSHSEATRRHSHSRQTEWPLSAGRDSPSKSTVKQDERATETTIGSHPEPPKGSDDKRKRPADRDSDPHHRQEPAHKRQDKVRPARDDSITTGHRHQQPGSAKARPSAVERSDQLKSTAHRDSARPAPLAGDHVQPDTGNQAVSGKPGRMRALAAPAPKARLSFGDELEGETDQQDGQAFSLSASTNHRFQTERALIQINPMLTDNVPTFVMPNERTAQASTAARPVSSMGRICFGVAQSRGLRQYMEDRHVIIPSYQVQTAGCAPLSDGIDRSFGAVLDGHNGPKAAEHATERLHKVLAAQPALRTVTGEAGATAAEQDAMTLAFAHSFSTVDDEILFRSRGTEDSDGSTCVALLRIGSSLWTAHVGDSRAVLSRGRSALRLTEDHKPMPGGPESERVRRAGGSVEFQQCWRVICPARDGRPASGLAVSRALGDINFKEPFRLVECEPEVAHYRLQPEDAFVIAASDGLWDVLSDQQAVDTAQAVLDVAMRTGSGGVRASEMLARAAAGALQSQALAAGSQDNITVLFLMLQWD